MSADIN